MTHGTVQPSVHYTAHVQFCRISCKLHDICGYYRLIILIAMGKQSKRGLNTLKKQNFAYYICYGVETDDGGKEMVVEVSNISSQNCVDLIKEGMSSCAKDLGQKAVLFPHEEIESCPNHLATAGNYAQLYGTRA